MGEVLEKYFCMVFAKTLADLKIMRTFALI